MPTPFSLVLRLILILLTCQASSQGIERTLSALKEIHQQPTSIVKDSSLAHEYNYLAEAYSGQQDSLAMVYIDSLRVLLERSSWSKTEGLLLRAQGKYHDRRGEFQQALNFYTLAIESFRAQGDQTELIAYTSILKGFVLSNNGMVEECRHTLEEFRPLASRLTNKNYLAWIIDWYGDQNFYTAFGKPDYPKALSFYLQVEQLLPQVKNKMIHADNAHGLAGCYLRLSEEAKANEYRDRALDIARKHQLHSVIFAVYGDMADVYEEKKDYPRTIEYRLLALEYARQTQWIEMEARALTTLSNTYKMAGDFENSLIHFEQLKAIEDSLARFEVQNTFHELEMKYESGKKDLEIQRLQSGKLRMWLYVAVALLIGGGLFLVYYRKTNRQLLVKNAALSKKNQEIQMALTEGQNIERKRMAIELHDNINAKIAAAKWVLETINTPEKSAEEKMVIDRLVSAMSDIYEDVRFISHNLVPKEIETKKLSEIVRQLVQNLNQNLKISFAFELEGTDPEVSTGLKLQCYAIIMELIHNTIKHSDCRKASIHLRYTTDNISLVVEDDGKGFDPESVNTGVGLKNLSTRLYSVNGKMDITQPDGKGSRISIHIPLTANQVSTEFNYRS